MQTQTSNILHNAIMEAGVKDRPPMLAPDKDVPVVESSTETLTERLKQGESINVQDIEANLYWEFGKFTSRDGLSKPVTTQNLPQTAKKAFTQILGYGYLVQGNVTINRVYYIEGLNHNLFSVGQFCDADLEVAFRKSTCFVRDLQGNDLLVGNRGSDLYTISLQESTSLTPLCLMDKATPTQAWLLHRMLSHINFDYINLLSKKDIVIGLPKLKNAESYVAPLAPKLRNNRTIYFDYLKHTQEETTNLREIVEHERSLNPLNTSLDYAYKYTKRIQELLIIIRQTYPCINNLVYEEASKVEPCPSEIILDDLLALDSIVHFDKASVKEIIVSNEVTDPALGFPNPASQCHTCGAKYYMT
nr:retrovirus-related Pol polyprotein from transposon TNT 1-94 [Tanacetum cinerariifolium]